MATETRSAGTHADDGAVGTLTWSNPGNAAASDNSYSTVSGGAGAVSHYHKSTNFGFTAIGDSDLLTELKLRIERKKSSGGNVQDNRVRLIFGGVIQSTEYAVATNYPSSDAYAEYTITTGLPTVAQLKNSGFGIAFSCKDTSGFSFGVDLDHTEAVATYTPVVAYTATAACTKGPATGSAACTFAPKCTGSAAPTAAHATCAATMAFAASVSLGSAALTTAPATGSASMTYVPPTYTVSAAATAAPAQAAAAALYAASIGIGTAAPTAGPATCAATMAYTPPTWTASVARAVAPVTAQSVGQTWRRGAWRYQRLTLHQS